MFPLANRKLIRGSLAHVLAGLGKGADYTASYVTLYAAFTGTIFLFKEWGGGNWLRLTRPNGDRLEFAHLHRYLVSTGQTVQEGHEIAVTGNSGKITSGPHLHVQVFVNGRRVDPEKYDWREHPSIPDLFKRIWGREAAPGEITYFEKRLANGTINGTEKLKEVMAYWHGIVYPNGTYSAAGDARWQLEKQKY